MLGLGIGIVSPAVLRRGTFAYEPESLAIFASFSTPPSVTNKININNLVVSLKTAGIWNELDLLYVLAAADSQAGRINWKSPGTKTASLVNSPTFTAYRGFTGNGTSSRLDTGWVPSTEGVKFTQNSASLWIWSRTAGATTTVDAGSTQSVILTRDGSDRTTYRINNSTSEFATTVTDGSGLFGAQRTGASVTKAFRNGTQTGTGTQASATPSASSQWILAGNGLNYGSRELSLAAWGASLSGKESLFYNIVLAYMQAVGAA